MSEWAKTEGASARERRYVDDVRAFLSAFVGGEDFDDDVALKELRTARGGWYEMRITFHPQHRIVGAFSRPGEFVALMQASRRALDGDFASAIHRSSAIWARLFGHYEPRREPRADLLEDFSP